MIGQADVEGKSSVEISNIIDDIERQSQTANHHLTIVLEENHRISRAILELRIKKKDSDIMVEKAKENMRRIESDLKILKNAFWTAKHAGT